MDRFVPGDVALVVCAPQHCMPGYSKYIGETVKILMGPNLTPPWESNLNGDWYEVETTSDKKKMWAINFVLHKPPPQNDYSEEYQWKSKKTPSPVPAQ